MEPVLVQAVGRGDLRTPNMPVAAGMVCMIPLTPDAEADTLME